MKAITKGYEQDTVDAARARQIFDRQVLRIEDLKLECDEAGLVRDKALYWLFRFCEVAEHEHLTMREEVKEIYEPAVQLLFEHNIYTGLPEPDHAILRLMEIVVPDLEPEPLVLRASCSCPQDCDCERPPTHLSNECPIHNENPYLAHDCPVHS